MISRRIRRLDDPAAFPAWAYRITSNKSRDWIRRRSRMRRADETYGQHRQETENGGNQSDRLFYRSPRCTGQPRRPRSGDPVAPL